ncbi:MAG TPA: GNAT family N-acetyltransferase [Isosphaeraceae bacterium]|nr:GNAT family N-acetyltransferase [Isosphaeraceae bacterium]
MNDQTNPTLTIRPAQPSDLAAIVEFNRRLALETEGKVLDPVILNLGVSRALAEPERLRYWVAEVDQPPRVVGQAAITREWSDWRNCWNWWLQSVYVTEPFRGKGIFRALYQQISDEARADNEVSGLRLYVEDSNQAAQHTYQAMGMKPAGYSVTRCTGAFVISHWSK